MPERVVARATGREHRPTIVGGQPAAGTLSCGDDLITDVGTLDTMAGDGIIALDMETAAIAAVCDDAGRPWSVFRAISDYAGSGLLDEALLALLRSDGTMDPELIAMFVAEHPERIDDLARFGNDAEPRHGSRGRGRGGRRAIARGLSRERSAASIRSRSRRCREWLPRRTRTRRSCRRR